MSTLIDILIKSNTLNFLIVVGLLFFIALKFNVEKLLQNIVDEIKSYVETSEDEKINSQKRLDIINGKIQKLPDIKERIKKSTQNSINNYQKKVQKDIEIEKKDITNNSDRLFRLETKKFKNKLTNLLSEKSIEIAKSNAIEQLKENPQLHNTYIENAIKELDEVNI